MDSAAAAAAAAAAAEEELTSPSTTASPVTQTSKRRKSEVDDRSTQPRAKRARYISIACNQCKRRKIKCNGQTPCQRCGNLGLECLYAPNCCNNFKDSEEFKQMLSHVNNLQQQVDNLYSNIANLRTQVDTKADVHALPAPQPQYSRSLPLPITNGPGYPAVQNPPKPVLPKFHGITSSAFGLNVAQSSLRNLGINPPEEHGEGMAMMEGSPGPSPPLPPLNIPRRESLHISKDPIWSIDRDEARRLLHIYEEEMGCMYPVVSLDKMEKHIDMLYNFMDATARSGLVQVGQPGADAFNDDQTHTLKLIMASALIAEGSGNSELGRRLFDAVRPSLEEQLFSAPDIKHITLLAIAAIFYFHADEEAMAWRLAGLAARLGMELGLHRCETYNTLFDNEEDREAATLLFWALRILDQRWSFGTGMPFAIHDADIDPLLRKPGPNSPYLAAMVGYASVATPVWERLTGFEPGRVKLPQEEIDYLDYQVMEWYRNIPEQLQYATPGQQESGQLSTRINNRLRIILYLRANQMRLHIHRPVLHSAARIAEHPNYARNAVDLSKDTIRVLTTMDRTTDVYRRQQVMFNYFLLTALATLFLAVCHAPDLFSNLCRDEFYMALDLVRSMTPQSFVAKRLWKTIRGLKEIGPKLGLRIPGAPNIDPAVGAHNNAAVAMASLAGHNMDEMAMYNNGHGSMGMGDIPNGMAGMADDLTNLFEAAGSYGGIGGMTIMPNGAGYPHPQPDTQHGVGIPHHGYGVGDDVSRILRNLF